MENKVLTNLIKAFSKFTTNLLRAVTNRYVRHCSSQSSFSEIMMELEQMKIKKKTEFVRRGLDSYLFDFSRPASDIIANLTESDQERHKKIKEEHGRLIINGYSYAPKELNDELALELLQVRTVSARMKVYEFFFRKKMRREKGRRKKESKALEGNLIQKDTVETHELPPYRCIRRIGETAQRKFYNTRMFATKDFAQTVVFDMSFEYTMRPKDIRSLVRQIKTSISVNRTTRDPFNFVFSNLSQDSNTYHQMKHELGLTLGQNKFEDIEDMPFDIVDHCLIEQADEKNKKDFVYLTPDSPNALKKFDHSKTYIIGALVDTVIVSPYTYKKARDLNVKHARLPFEKYLNWTSGRKTLTADVMMRILLTLKQTEDFNEAFKHVPARHTKDVDKLSRYLRHFDEARD